MPTLTVNFTLASAAPVGGYLVQYWPVGKKDQLISKTVTATPAVFNGVDAGSYEGSIQAVCGGGNFSNATTFTATLADTKPFIISGATPVATCGVAASGSLKVVTAGYKAKVTTVYYSGTGSRVGATLTIKQGTTVIATVTAPVTQSNTPVTVASSSSLAVGDYTWILTLVNCTNGSGTSAFSMSNT
jgi:hypothetical protein